MYINDREKLTYNSKLLLIHLMLMLINSYFHIFQLVYSYHQNNSQRLRKLVNFQKEIQDLIIDLNSYRYIDTLMYHSYINMYI